MSVSVVALPLSIQILTAIAPIAITAFTVGFDAITKASDNMLIGTDSLDELEEFEKAQRECKTKYIPESHFLEKAFTTPFMDKEILIKTLSEHGISIEENFDNKIVGKFSTYNLVFTRNNESEAYNVVISYAEKDNAEEKIQDLNSEYASNVQEDSYLSIIKKLKDNKMELESEEVLEDDTIVLTINLE